MPTFERIRDRLPSLYRPEDNDTSLLSVWIRAVAVVLDSVQQESNTVMQSHWFTYADQAMFNPWFLRARALSRPPKAYPQPGDPELSTFPYIDDLARLGALIPVSPWEQPPQLRDLVEDYRQRIADMVNVYRNGMGTVGTLRRMVEAQLPVNQAASPDRSDRPFWIEEFAPSRKDSYPVPARGDPLTMVGPLMRWTINNDSLNPIASNVYIKGVSAVAGKVDATTSPLIELYAVGSMKPRVGLAYTDTIAPGQTLRLRPSATSWLAQDAGIARADSLPPEGGYADPTAPGPWQPVADGPQDAVVAIVIAQDSSLWVASNTGAAGSLHRFDGKTWSVALSGLSLIHSLAEDGTDLLIGTDTGLLRMPLYPASGTFASTPEPGLATHKVLSIYRSADGKAWFGTEAGAFFQAPGGAVTPSPLQGVAVNAVAQDSSGVQYFGTPLAVFQWQSGSNSWYWYEGKNFGEENPDWQPFFPDKQGPDRNFPTAPQPFLPPVNSVWCDRHGSVWFGTDNGVARYTASPDESLNLQTVLEAFPDIAAGRVFSIAEDGRGLLWFATDRGLFRYDGRDWWQAQAGTFVHLGRADRIYPSGAARGQWRFDRSSSKWQRLAETWIAFDGALRSTAEPSVRGMAWSDGVVADLGNWDGSSFSGPQPVPPDKLVVRVKPNEQTILNGGIAALPRLPQGESIWRYLSMEPAGLVPPSPRPWWSTEGRLIPPPPDLPAPGEGRYDVNLPLPESSYDEAVFAYNPAAQVWFEWESALPLSVLVRLKKVAPNETVDPAIVDRVWQGIEQVRPAGVRVRLAVEEQIVKS